jgi:Arc/MetJ-type ribon-helix-helix transcriptional regulator
MEHSGDERESIATLTAERDEAEARFQAQRNQAGVFKSQRDEALAKLAAMTADECVYMAEPRGAFGLAEGWCATHDNGWVYCKAGQPRLIELLRYHVTELEEERDALQARANQLERIVRVLVNRMEQPHGDGWKIEGFLYTDSFSPGDFDYLRQLIESEIGQ